MKSGHAASNLESLQWEREVLHFQTWFIPGRIADMILNSLPERHVRIFAMKLLEMAGEKDPNAEFEEIHLKMARILGRDVEGVPVDG